MSKANPVSYSLIRLPHHNSSRSRRRRRLIRPSCAAPSRGVLVTDLVTDSHGAAQRACTTPDLARKRPLRDEQRSDVRDEVSLVGVGRPTPSAMNATSSVPADPGSLATGRCGGQGSLARTCPGPPSTARPRLMQSRGQVGRSQCAWVSTASGAGQYGSET